MQKSVNEKCRKLLKRIAFYTVDCRDSCGEIFVDMQNYFYTKVKCLQFTIFVLYALDTCVNYMVNFWCLSPTLFHLFEFLLKLWIGLMWLSYRSWVCYCGNSAVDMTLCTTFIIGFFGIWMAIRFFSSPPDRKMVMKQLNAI